MLCSIRLANESRCARYLVNKQTNKKVQVAEQPPLRHEWSGDSEDVIWHNTAVLAASPLELHSLGRNNLNFLFLFRNNTAERRGAVSAQRRHSVAGNISIGAGGCHQTPLLPHKSLCINFFISMVTIKYFVISR